MNEYYDWCNQNNVPLNFTEPKYKVGRIRLGEISTEYTMQQIQELVLEYPNIVDIVAINDK